MSVTTATNEENKSTRYIAAAISTASKEKIERVIINIIEGRERAAKARRREVKPVLVCSEAFVPAIFMAAANERNTRRNKQINDRGICDQKRCCKNADTHTFAHMHTHLTSKKLKQDVMKKKKKNRKN